MQSWRWAPKWVLFYNYRNQLFGNSIFHELVQPLLKIMYSKETKNARINDVSIPELSVASYAARFQAN